MDPENGLRSCKRFISQQRILHFYIVLIGLTQHVQEENPSAQVRESFDGHWHCISPDCLPP